MSTWKDERDALAAEWFRRARMGVADSYVYRYFDAQGALLYVGQTSHLATRDKNHRNTMDWYAQVARRTVEGPFTKDIALAHEFEALNHEEPSFNRTQANGYSGPYSLAWYIVESEEYQRRCQADPEFRGNEMRDVLEGLIRRAS